MIVSLCVCLPPVHIQHEGQVPGKLPTRPQQQQLRSKLEERCLLSLQSKAPLIHVLFPQPRQVSPHLAILIFDAHSPTQLIKDVLASCKYCCQRNVPEASCAVSSWPVQFRQLVQRGGSRGLHSALSLCVCAREHL